MELTWKPTNNKRPNFLWLVVFHVTLLIAKEFVTDKRLEIYCIVQTSKECKVHKSLHMEVAFSKHVCVYEARPPSASGIGAVNTWNVLHKLVYCLVAWPHSPLLWLVPLHSFEVAGDLVRFFFGLTCCEVRAV